MIKYWQIIQDSFIGYWNYLYNDVSRPDLTSYFYWLLGLSLIVWFLEVVLPWRRDQAFIRKDFWLDAFYMLFNFFLFSLIGFNALSNIGVELFNDFLGLFGVNNLIAIKVGNFPSWIQLVILFIVADFVQWNVHRLLHRVPFLWEFHKLHHSVKEMGFAAHLRFHWMETIIYKSIQYIPLAMIGFGIDDFFVVHIITILIGHLNHANLNWDYGWFKFIINNPKMHIWHHAKDLPKEYRYGMNFGISLSLWDYIFGTAYIPKNGRDVELGFCDEKQFPAFLLRQLIYPFWKKRNE